MVCAPRLAVQLTEFTVFVFVLKNGVEIYDECGNFKTFYETFQNGKTPTGEGKGVVDVIITGKV